MATKKNARKSGGRAGSKTAFILRFPEGMPAKDVVAKAAAAGINVSEKYVYNIRSAHRGKAGKATRGPGRPPKATGNAVRIGKRGPGRPRAGGGDLEQQLRTAIAEAGLARARAVFDEVAAAFGG